VWEANEFQTTGRLRKVLKPRARSVLRGKLLKKSRRSWTPRVLWDPRSDFWLPTFGSFHRPL